MNKDKNCILCGGECTDTILWNVTTKLLKICHGCDIKLGRYHCSICDGCRKLSGEVLKHSGYMDKMVCLRCHNEAREKHERRY